MRRAVEEVPAQHAIEMQRRDAPRVIDGRVW
jgi:hypothetical protein